MKISVSDTDCVSNIQDIFTFIMADAGYKIDTNMPFAKLNPFTTIKRVNMNRLIVCSILLIFSSCEKKGSINNGEQIRDTLASVGKEKSRSPKPAKESRMHDSLTENIDSLSQALQSFIPANYSAIKLSSGYANLDGLTDRIIVLGKIGEENTSSSGDGKEEK